MKTTKQQWDIIYKEYEKECAEQLIIDYAWKRNLDLPSGCLEYTVDRKRYPDDFWAELIDEHRKYGYCPFNVTMFARRITGGRMPWPDMLRRLPELLSLDSSLEKRFQRLTIASSSFSSAVSKSRNRKELIDTLLTWNKDHRDKQPNDANDFALMLTTPEGKTALIDAPAWRSLAANILIYACDQKTMKDMERVLGELLPEFAQRIDATSRD